MLCWDRKRPLISRRHDGGVPALSVEENGDVVGGELRVGLPAGTGSDGGCAVSGLVEILDECVGQMADVGAVPLDDEFGSAGLSLAHGAGLACVLIRWRRGEAAGLKKFCHLMFDRFGCERFNAVAEVLYGEEEALIADGGDADDVEVGVEEVGAMGGGGHPDLLQVGGSRSVPGDVL